VPSPLTVRLATRDELPAAARALARAFEGDPVWRWLTTVTDEWDRLASAWFQAEITVRYDHGAEIWVDDDLRGAAVWTPPGTWKSTPGDIVRVAYPTLRLMGRRLVLGAGLQNAMEKTHPKTPEHWYLALLGTDPRYQGAGIGGALLRAVLDRCDREGVPAYLESSKETNVPYYERFGFVRTGGVHFRDAPVQATMWRDPEATA
jgi:GNAT superfamily N-acetyltransferase